MNSKDDLKKMLSDNNGSVGEFLLSFDFSNIELNTSDREDQKIINSIFSNAVKLIFNRYQVVKTYNDSIYARSHLIYVLDKLKQSLQNIFDINFADCEDDNNVYRRPFSRILVKISCGDKLRYYSYYDDNFSLINSEKFQNSTLLTNTVHLKLKEMEFLND